MKCKWCGYGHLEISRSPYYVDGLCSHCTYIAEVIHAIWTDSPFYPNRELPNYPIYGKQKASKHIDKILDRKSKKIKCPYCKKLLKLTTFISGHPDYHEGKCSYCNKDIMRNLVRGLI